MPNFVKSIFFARFIAKTMFKVFFKRSSVIGTKKGVLIKHGAPCGFFKDNLIWGNLHNVFTTKEFCVLASVKERSVNLGIRVCLKKKVMNSLKRRREKTT